MRCGLVSTRALGKTELITDSANFPQLARPDPLLGVPINMIPYVELRIDLRCSLCPMWQSPELIKACYYISIYLKFIEREYIYLLV